MSDEQGPDRSVTADRSVNFVDAPAPRSRGRARPADSRPKAPEPADTGGRAKGVLAGLPVPLPVVLGLAAVAFVLLGLGAVRLATRGGTTPAGATDAATPPATAVRAGTEPPVTTPASAPLPTRPPAEEDAARRATFIESMKGMGLTQAQATCAADKVQATMGWTEVSESLMDSGKPGQLQDLLLACVKNGK